MPPFKLVVVTAAFPIANMLLAAVSVTLCGYMAITSITPAVSRLVNMGSLMAAGYGQAPVVIPNNLPGSVIQARTEMNLCPGFGQRLLIIDGFSHETGGTR